MSTKDLTILDKQDFNKFFSALSKKFQIFGPIKKDGSISFAKVDSPGEIAFDYDNSKMSLKDFFLPQTQNLFFFDVNKNEVEKPAIDVKDEEQEKILFGVRPCDAMAISLLDRVFAATDPSDCYYTNRRNVSRIIALACNNPGPACFCTSVGGDPDSEVGADAIFYRLNGRYLIKTITKGGEDILGLVGELLKPVADNDLTEKTNLMKTAKERIKKLFDVQDLEKKFDDFGASYWETLHNKCLGCGICTFFCPTCHCFDITDETIKSRGRRIRTWDSCMFPLFTLHASGHNPRPTHKERMRQRIMHKFNYAFKNYGQALCVGCGRCIIQCPVNIDIRRIIMDIMEEV
jgi:sulfhydrogenase subunit beta (sulfur reductase)